MNFKNKHVCLCEFRFHPFGVFLLIYIIYLFAYEKEEIKKFPEKSYVPKNLVELALFTHSAQLTTV